MEKNQQRPRKKYDEAFKRSAVDMLLHSGKSIQQLALELGVSSWNLRDWKRRYAAPASAGGTTARSLDEAQTQIAALQKELLRVKTQRDILKKTLGILSTPGDSDFNA